MACKALAAIALLLVCACSSSREEVRLQEFHGEAMTIPYRILVAEGSHQKSIESILQTTFDEIDRTYNKWNPRSELSRLNQAPPDQEIELSPSLYHFLELTAFYVDLTEGLFDPTIEPVQQVWKRNLENGVLPLEAEIREAEKAVGWKKLLLRDGKALKTQAGLQIDLGGIVKGYTVDLLVDRLNEAGYHHVFVEWGGEIRATGFHPEGRPWTIYISRLGDADPEKAPAIFELDGRGVATSGDYLQQWTVNGQVFTHIIDPRTLRPLVATHHSVASVTVIAPTCLAADALATAAMIQPTVSEAKEWIANIFPHTEYWIYSRETLRRDRGFRESSLRNIKHL